jgi:uncharacterized membrane protein YdbT with pleckstrin-like domain
VAIPYRLLMDGEEVVVHRHPHVRVLLRPVAVTIAVFVAAGVLVATVSQGSLRAGIVAVALLAAVVIVARPLLHWLTTTLTVTDRRLLLRSGVFARYGRDIPLERIVEASFEHTLFERMLGCGTLHVELASGRGMVVVQNVPHVEDVHGAIYELLEDEYDEDDDLDEGPVDGEPEPEDWDTPTPGRRWLRRRQAEV